MECNITWLGVFVFVRVLFRVSERCHGLCERTNRVFEIPIFEQFILQAFHTNGLRRKRPYRKCRTSRRFESECRLSRLYSENKLPPENHFLLFESGKQSTYKPIGQTKMFSGFVLCGVCIYICRGQKSLSTDNTYFIDNFAICDIVTHFDFIIATKQTQIKMTKWKLDSSS